MFGTVCRFIAAVNEQNQQSAVFSEERQTPADVNNAEDTLHHIDESGVEHCSLRLFKPSRVSRSLGRTRRNTRLRPRALHTKQSASATAASVSLSQSRG